MKRWWLVLLSLGLMIAFSTQAMAVDVKFSGQYYMAGMYMDKGALIKNTSLTNTSTAFYFQRLRLTTTFIVAPGLFLNTRADIMERAWGAARSTPGTAADTASSGTRAENENIAFDYASFTYSSPFGMLMAGIMSNGVWGTTFGNTEAPLGKVQYFGIFGPIQVVAYIGKAYEGSRTAINPANATDRDYDIYWGSATYVGRQIQGGLGVAHIRNASTRALGYKGQYTNVMPWVKTTLGPVALQAEVNYFFGKFRDYDDEATPDIDVSALSAYLDANADFGMFYAGASLAYLSGDDPSSTDKMEGGINTGGLDWNPCLIMFNNDMTYWQGGQFGEVTATTSTSNRGPMTNAYFAQVRAGVRPVDKLDIMASVSLAQADKTLASQWQGRGYGYEVDLTATYKITDNLSYMLGGGYFFTGDWYKGINASGTNEVTNQFIVINKLTLTF
ncbi:MAG: hypothetical protein K4571_15350 [Deltaproteobacteria bacterium]